MKEQWKLVLTLLIVIFIVVFALQNTDTVTISYFFGKITNVPLVLVILVSLLVGVVLGLFASLSAISSQKRLRRELQSEIEQLKQDKMRDLEEKDNQLLNLKQQVKDLEQKLKNTASFSETEVTPSITEDAAQ